MFPSGAGSEGIDMSQLLQQAQRMQEQLASAQQDFADAEVTGSAGGGLVLATVTGAGDFTALEIDPSVVDPDDIETLADLIIAAFRDAQSQLQQRASEQFGAVGAGIEGLLGGAGEGSPLGGLLGGAGAPDDHSDDEPGGSPGAISP